MVHQHFALFDTLTVTDNIQLGLPADWAPGRVRARLAEVAERYGLAVPDERRQPTWQGQGETQTEAGGKSILLAHQNHDGAQHQPGQQAGEHAPPEAETEAIGGEQSESLQSLHEWERPWSLNEIGIWSRGRR
jgi:hypothetical protein